MDVSPSEKGRAPRLKRLGCCWWEERSFREVMGHPIHKRMSDGGCSVNGCAWLEPTVRGISWKNLAESVCRFPLPCTSVHASKSRRPQSKRTQLCVEMKVCFRRSLHHIFGPYPEVSTGNCVSQEIWRVLAETRELKTSFWRCVWMHLLFLTCARHRSSLKLPSVSTSHIYLYSNGEVLFVTGQIQKSTASVLGCCLGLIFDVKLDTNICMDTLRFWCVTITTRWIEWK